MIATTLSGALDNYLLYRDHKPESSAWYRRIISVFCRWAGGEVLVADFNGEQISRLLADKQRAGRKPSYVKSLRNGLMAVLRDIRGNAPVERVRTIRVPPLDPQAWTTAEVERLLKACRRMPARSQVKWTLIVAAGYYTGLDRCDLERIERKDIGEDGSIFWRRSKTGKPVLVAIPLELVAMIDEHCPHKGRVFCMGITKEWFRRIFAGIVRRARMHGTFKKLRKSSGSAVEAATPGKGHKHLGNTRAIFERHYEARRLTQNEPTMPPVIRLPTA